MRTRRASAAIGPAPVAALPRPLLFRGMPSAEPTDDVIDWAIVGVLLLVLVAVVAWAALSGVSFPSLVPPHPTVAPFIE